MEGKSSRILWLRLADVVCGLGYVFGQRERELARQTDGRTDRRTAFGYNLVGRTRCMLHVAVP